MLQEFRRHSAALAPLPEQRPTLAISACLVGQQVRYDGRHKLSEHRQRLATLAELTPFCPEVAIGLGIPRPPIEQRWLAGQLAVVQVDDWQQESTAALRDYAQHLAQVFTQQRISGYVLTPKSPSCALHSGRVFRADEQVSNTAPGFFVRCLQTHLPHLPMIEEPDLAQPQAFSAFLLQAHLYHRWHTAPPQNHAALMQFHWHHYVQFLATAPSALQGLDAWLQHPGPCQDYLPQALALCAQAGTAQQHRAALLVLAEGINNTGNMPLTQLQRATRAMEHSYFHLLPLFAGVCGGGFV